MEQNRPQRICGVVTPPEDLGPAIEALGDKGRSYLKGLSQGEPITPDMLAKAADYERGEGR